MTFSTEVLILECGLLGMPTKKVGDDVQKQLIVWKMKSMIYIY